jgi:glycosyltransferase involved in cell wall biosynthesis
MHTAPVQAKKRILWLHDHNYGPGAGPDLTKWETVLGVSRYHADWLTEAYELVRPADFVPNGIDLARFPADVPKVFGRCVYASSPDRGLIDLLQMWPAIAKVDPKAELHVAYGWNTFDRLIASGRQDIAEQKAAIEKVLAKTPQVVMRGRLGQNDLAMLYSESVAMLYPTSFLETSCIGVMEACAGGCVPIVSTAGALKETAREGGIIVSGPNGTPSSPWSTAWRDFFVHVAQGVLFDSVVRRHGEQRARAAAPSFAWARSFEKWDEVVAA